MSLLNTSVNSQTNYTSVVYAIWPPWLCSFILFMTGCVKLLEPLPDRMPHTAMCDNELRQTDSNFPKSMSLGIVYSNSKC